MSILIKNAKIVHNEQFETVNILIEDEKISDIKLSGSFDADETIDAKNNLVMPGAIDIHVHVRDPGQEYKEDWKTASMAAAHGGVTTIFDMPNNPNTITTKEKLLEKLEIAKQKSIVNYGAYYGLSKSNLDTLMDVRDITCGFKLIMDKTTGDLLIKDKKVQEKCIEKIFPTGKVVACHAEDYDINEEYGIKFKDRDDPLVHSDSRPDFSEEKAIKEIIGYTQKYGTKSHITHLSTKLGMDAISKAKADNINITCDTTHSYLFLSRKDLQEKGGFSKMNPPVRTEQDMSRLWQGLNSGEIDIIATDHAPHTIQEKSQKFRSVPSGLPHLDTFFPMLFDAVNKDRISINRLIKLTSENPAKRYSILNKGFLKVGYDADITIVDLKLEDEVKREDLFTKCGWSPFEGRRLKGWPIKTIVNGKLVFNEGEIYSSTGEKVQFKKY